MCGWLQSFWVVTRPPGFLAAIWPANAVLLTLFIRMPFAAGPLGVVAAAAAYMLVDLYVGSSTAHTLLLNSSNMVSALGCFFAWSSLSKGRSFLETPNAALALILASAAGSAAAGVIGAPSDRILFGGGYWNGWCFWFATEFNNYMIFLPALLSAPSLKDKAAWKALFRPSKFPAHLLPALAVVLSVSISTFVGGPGALAFPIPALLWAALTYSVFPVAILVLLFSFWIGLAISTGGFLDVGPTDQVPLVSLRLGISLIALFPVVLSCVIRSREELLRELKHSATHDALTDTLNGSAFRERGQAELARGGRPVVLLALDIDHFKQINDTYGHAAGDSALIGFATRAQRYLRPGHLFGRIGGEEFAALLPDCAEGEGLEIAEQIRSAIKEPVEIDEERSLQLTVSTGLAAGRAGAATSIEALLRDADQLLYQAKRKGRDRVETRLEELEPQPQ